MKNTLYLVTCWALTSFLLSATACDQPQKTSKNEKPASLDTLRMALDWSPNILHAGIFLAEARSEFEAEGLFIDWFTPEIDNYQKKPILRLLDKEVDLSIGPSEHLLYYALDTQTLKPRAEAIATLLSKPQSAFAVKAQSEVYSPSDWGDIDYIGYDTPLEEAILKTMVLQSGGQQLPTIVQPGRLQVWDVFKEQPNALAWIFTHWEGQMTDDSLRYFYPNEWGVPYGYSSVIMARKDRNEFQNQRLQTFLKILRKNYLLLGQASAENREAIARELTAFIEHPNFSSTQLIEKAWQDIQPAFTVSPAKKWGQMTSSRWQNYLHWIQENELLKTDIHPDMPEAWFTNSLLKGTE